MTADVAPEVEKADKKTLTDEEVAKDVAEETAAEGKMAFLSALCSSLQTCSCF